MSMTVAERRLATSTEMVNQCLAAGKDATEWKRRMIEDQDQVNAERLLAERDAKLREEFGLLQANGTELNRHAVGVSELSEWLAGF